MLDVAAVAMELLDHIPTHTRDRLLHPSVDRSHCLDATQLGLLVACHDLGKISPGFQIKVPRLWERLSPELRRGRHFDPMHGRVTYRCLPEHLTALGASPEVADVVARVLGGHHGAVPHREILEKDCGRDPWPDLRGATFKALVDALGVEDLGPLKDVSSAWLLLLAGFTSVADWIGSSHHFPYAPGDQPNAAYLRERRRLAGGVLKNLGWSAWDSERVPLNFSKLFPELSKDGTGAVPRGLQANLCQIADQLTAGDLLILEAATGSGKTEASLLAALALCRPGNLGGLYYALPTQATSNQMFSRVRRFLSRLPRTEGLQLHLMHGLSDLTEDYADLVAQTRELRIRSLDGPAARDRSSDDLDGIAESESLEAEVVADEWFRAGRRGLLSTVAVGTVDQALLAALQAKHFFVRLFGLAGKVVVIDEVHAYDTYMSTILEELLTWLSSLGSSVVLLSATLPSDRRIRLLEAWNPDTQPPAAPGLPRLTHVSRSGKCTSIEAQPDPGRVIPLEQLGHDVEEIADILLARTIEGGCALWIVNTVRRAQEAFAALTAKGLRVGQELVQFHSRFPVDERLERETFLLERLSRNGERPERLIAVTTQVVEQSLDIDADLMVTDLAPIDLMIQRVGRLHRHDRDARPPGCREPRLFWSAPPEGSSQEEWRSRTLPYDAHIQLRSLHTFRDRGFWRLPADSDQLLEEVYGEHEDPDAQQTELWRATRDTLEATRSRSRDKAARNLARHRMEPREVIERLHKCLDDDPDSQGRGVFRADTREIDATVSIACLFIDEEEQTFLDRSLEKPTPLRGKLDRQQQRLLQRRVVTLSGHRAVACGARLEHPRSWQTLPGLRRAHVIRLDPQGRPAGPDSHHTWFHLDAHRGVVLDFDGFQGGP